MIALLAASTLSTPPSTLRERYLPRFLRENLVSSWDSTAPPAVSQPFYEALRKYEALADEATWHVNTPLKPGDIALFDNRRIMHSRTEFTGERWMEGSYVSWESVWATWRALRWQVEGGGYEYAGIGIGQGCGPLM